MIAFVIIIAIVVLATTRKRTDNSDYLSCNDTGIINGIFVYLIFLSHSTQYYSLNDVFPDRLYEHFQNFHNQWVVATFLSFSGYGVMYSFMKKGEQYIKSFPQKRLLKTLFNFDIAVVMYCIVNLLIGRQYSFYNYVFSFIGLTSIGNSNWYIFTILLMYMVSYIAAIICKSYHNIPVIVTICAVMYLVIAHIVGLPSRFVSTVVCYPLGMWIMLYKDDIQKMFKKNWLSTLVILLIPLAITYKIRYNDYIMNLASCFFVLIVVWFLVHFKIKSKVLKQFGNHAFSIYILQRLPMVILTHFYEPTGYMIYVFVIVNLGITFALAMLFDKVLKHIDEKLF